MGVRVVMELSGDNDQLHERNLNKVCEALDAEPGGEVKSCLITTGTVTISEEINGDLDPHRRPQRRVR